MKGYYMKGGSYQQEKSAFINLNDMDLYGLLKRTDAYIRNWEMVNAYQTILQGQQAYAQYLSTVRQQNQQRQAPGYPQENPAYTGDQYEQDQVIIMVKVSISTQSHNISIIILIIRGTHHEQYKSLPGCTSVSRQ